MKTIPLSEAEGHLGELLARTAKGEVFTVISHGRAIGRIMPPEEVPAIVGERDPKAVAEAVEFLTSTRGLLADLSVEEVLNLKNEGRRY
jgi:prevent-host-death family protein